MKLVAVEGIEPTSLDYQSSALSLSYTAMVDPTGLKPAPHGLKGRRSVPRAPGQQLFDFRFLIFDSTGHELIANQKFQIQNQT